MASDSPIPRIPPCSQRPHHSPLHPAAFQFGLCNLHKAHSIPRFPQEFHPTWSRAISSAPSPASHLAFSDPNSLASPPWLCTCILTLFLPSPSPPHPVLSPAHPGPSFPDNRAGQRPAESWGRGLPPGPWLTLWAPNACTRSSLATRATAVFMSLQVPRHPAAHSCSSPGRACRLDVTASPDNQGPGSHRSGRSWAPHAHPLTAPRAGRGKGDPGSFGPSQPPPPSWPLVGTGTGKAARAPLELYPQLRSSQVTALGPPSPGPAGWRGTQVCWHQRLRPGVFPRPLPPPCFLFFAIPSFCLPLSKLSLLWHLPSGPPLSPRPSQPAENGK